MVEGGVLGGWEVIKINFGLPFKMYKLKNDSQKCQKAASSQFFGARTVNSISTLFIC